MRTIEQILTPDELKRLAEPNEFEQVFGAMHIFGIGNFGMSGQVSLTGDELGGDYLKVQNRTSVHDQDILLGDLPSCRQECIGKLAFYALTDKRRIVVLSPSRGYEKLFPHGYLVRSGNALFAVRQFPHLKDRSGFFNEEFMWIEPVMLGRNAHHNTMVRQGIPGWLNWTTDRDSYGFIGFNDSQWQLLKTMLDAWLPE